MICVCVCVCVREISNESTGKIMEKPEKNTGKTMSSV